MSHTTASSSGGVPPEPTHRSGRVKSLAFRIGARCEPFQCPCNGTIKWPSDPHHYAL